MFSVSSSNNSDQRSNRFYQNLGGIFINTFIHHPLEYSKILIQLDYQPLPCFPTRSIFGTPRIGLPGVFSYIGFIYNNDGFLGLYRGLTYKIASVITYETVYSKTNKLINEKNYFTLKNSEATEQYESSGLSLDNPKLFQFRIYTNRIMQKSICRIAALTASYPFYVLMNRCCSQFIGREHIYSNFSSAVTDIIQNEGLLGFYSGFVPKVIGELLVIWVSHAAIIIVTSPMVLPKELNGLNFYISQMITFVVQSIFYPFQLVSSIMSVNSCQTLTAARIEPYFLRWQDCWLYLSQLGDLKRGASLFWRHKPLPQGTVFPIEKIYKKKSISTVPHYDKSL